MADVPGDLAELYRAWSDEELVRRYRGGGLAEAARKTLERELRARGLDPAALLPREAEEPLVEFRVLDRATHGELLDALAARLEANSVPQGRSFFIDAGTLEMLERDGLDPASLEKLRAELGDLEGIEVIDPSVPESGIEEFVHNPLRFTIRGRMMGPLHPYYIDDEQGQRVYEVAQTPAFERYQVEDLQRRVLVEVNRKLMSLGTYLVMREEREVAEVHWDRQEIALRDGRPLVCDFTTTSSSNLLRRDGRLVARMDGGNLLNLGSVRLDIDRGQDRIDLLGVLLALALTARENLRTTMTVVDNLLK